MDIELTDVSRTLILQTGHLAPHRSYQRLWAAIVDGRLQAAKVSGRWRIRREELPVAAKILGMTDVAAEPAECAA
ncbi:hypothetical protein [Belnapia moabensis]|uniref:hypothetical protein n=1 Tax=Belnapia moabensis TaxID=365533 RepID=UPI0012EDD8B4|nr:hypothetical protein [Belnapia moabensis]